MDLHSTQSGSLEKVRKAKLKYQDITADYDVKPHQFWILPEAKKSGNLAKIDAQHLVFKIGLSMVPYPDQEYYS